VALMGLGGFYQLDAQALRAEEYSDPALDGLRATPPGQRQYRAVSLYRRAAWSGDPFANYLAGRSAWESLRANPGTRRAVEAYLTVAQSKGHKRAAALLEQIKAGGG
ncbi:MAG: hypothetical protein JWO31_1671, partial [Phycisphaerales bacterium]|nr:hypothetical protein [Phycisphaerales bacterium]